LKIVPRSGSVGRARERERERTREREEFCESFPTEIWLELGGGEEDEGERKREVRKKYCNGVAVGLGEFGARNSGFGVATRVGSWVWTEGRGETHRGGSWSL